jgi:hypothetical protein
LSPGGWQITCWPNDESALAPNERLYFLFSFAGGVTMTPKKDITKPCPKCDAIDWNTDKKCRSCTNARIRARRAAKPEEVRAKERATRTANRHKYKVSEHAWRKAHPESQKNIVLRTMYRISLAEYMSMVEAQDGVCAICKKPETMCRKGTLQLLSIDHDHMCCPGPKACGKCIRGLLCKRCNGGLGHFGDNIVLLQAAIEYLQAGGWRAP